VSGERTTSCVACASVPDLDGGVVRLRVVVLLVGCAKLCVIELRSRKTEPAPRTRALPDCRMMEAKTFLALLLTLWTDRHEKPHALEDQMPYLSLIQLQNHQVDFRCSVLCRRIIYKCIDR